MKLNGLQSFHEQLYKYDVNNTRETQCEAEMLVLKRKYNKVTSIFYPQATARK
jgi:hypothetical protein